MVSGVFLEHRSIVSRAGALVTEEETSMESLVTGSESCKTAMQDTSSMLAEGSRSLFSLHRGT